MKLLKEYIQLILQEKAVDSAQAAGEGLALTVVDDDVYVLYDPGAFDKIAQQPELLKKAMAKGDENFFIQRKCIVGMIRFTAPEQGPAWGANEIKLSAAEQGYGPLMYDIAMQLSPNGIIGDRQSVSDKAKKVWTYFLKNRSDVKSLPLDDIEDPKTKDKKDDAKVYSGGKDNPLNYAYKAKGANVGKLKQNHLKYIKNNLLKSPESFEHLLDSLSSLFFSINYLSGKE